MSPELKEFYIELQKWIDEGAQKNEYFVPWTGLCSNLVDWVWLNTRDSQVGKVLNELTQQFINAGLSENYPFNEHAGEYARECSASFTYKTNQARLDWIKKWSQHE